MRTLTIGILFAICFGQVAFADTTYICTRGDMERRIEVVYLGADTVPCEVRYTKTGTAEVLWIAQAEEGYCETRAAEFVEKQRGWGWECVESAADMSASSAPDMPEEQGAE